MKHPLNNKGITPIISVILLLMMTIAVAGLAYTWLQGLQGSVQTSTENRTEALLGDIHVSLKLDSAELMNCTGNKANVSVHFRNSGTHAANNVQLFVDNRHINSANKTILAAGATANFTYTDVSGLKNVAWVNTTRTFRIESDEASVENTYGLVCP